MKVITWPGTAHGESVSPRPRQLCAVRQWSLETGRPGHWQWGGGDPGDNMSTLIPQWSCHLCSQSSCEILVTKGTIGVKIQFSFGSVPIHSWTWQIFFIINHMLAPTHNLLPKECSRCGENLKLYEWSKVWIFECERLLIIVKRTPNQTCYFPLSPDINKAGGVAAAEGGGVSGPDQLMPPPKSRNFLATVSLFSVKIQ